MINPAFVEANYEVLESILRERRRQRRNEDLLTKLDSEEYDEEREMKPRPTRALARSGILISHGLAHPLGAFPNSYPFNALPMYPLPNVHIYPNQAPSCLFADYTGCVAPLVRWIEDNPLPDRLKMPSHIRSYDGKGYPDNFLHLFEEQRILGFIHGLRTISLVEFLSTYLLTTCKDMEKTYTWIEAKEVATNGTPNDHQESSNKFKRNSSWDNNKGRKNRDRFYPYQVPNHGLLSNLSKSPREIMATEKVARNFKQPSCLPGSKRSRDMSKYYHFHKDHEHDKNQCRELRHQIKEAVKSRRLVHLVKEVGKAKVSNTQLGDWKKGDRGEQSWPLGKVPLEITIGEGPFKIESLAKFRLKCFLDAHKGYHQIPMAKEDKEKTTFFTREGVFCYKRLPFSLKNVGATYQRLVDTVFSNQIRRNLKVHVEDLVIKSDSEEDMLAHIQETFDKLRAINMKLNPRKCSFGMEEDPFMGREYTYALMFEFETTNNEAGYEALLAGLQITEEMKIEDLYIFVDSQLVANQVKGIFEARQPVIKQYLEKTREILKSFKSYSMEHVKQDQNKKADALSKLASMTFSNFVKEVLVEVLHEKSIVGKKVMDIIKEEGET
nr:hypothetical protein [Tanacetum cinerariifolium]